MPALMYDSDSETYPDGVEYIAAYVDGSRTGRNFDKARAKCPRAKFLTISAVGEVDADVIDIEPGNVWPPENAVDWTIRQRARGGNPGYYCNTSQRQQVLDAYAARGVDPGWWWRADYRSPVSRPASFALGEAAHQYADPPMTGSHWDVSVISAELQSHIDGDPAPLLGDTTPDATPIDSATSEQIIKETLMGNPVIARVNNDDSGDEYLIHLESGRLLVDHIADGDHSGPLQTAFGEAKPMSRPEIARVVEYFQGLGYTIAGSGV
jgi:hypothetical protein